MLMTYLKNKDKFYHYLDLLQDYSFTGPLDMPKYGLIPNDLNYAIKTIKRNFSDINNRNIEFPINYKDTLFNTQKSCYNAIYYDLKKFKEYYTNIMVARTKSYLIGFEPLIDRKNTPLENIYKIFESIVVDIFMKEECPNIIPVINYCDDLTKEIIFQCIYLGSMVAVNGDYDFQLEDNKKHFDDLIETIIETIKPPLILIYNTQEKCEYFRDKIKLIESKNIVVQLNNNDKLEHDIIYKDKDLSIDYKSSGILNLIKFLNTSSKDLKMTFEFTHRVLTDVIFEGVLKENSNKESLLFDCPLQGTFIIDHTCLPNKISVGQDVIFEKKRGILNRNE